MKINPEDREIVLKYMPYHKNTSDDNQLFKSTYEESIRLESKIIRLNSELKEAKIQESQFKKVVSKYHLQYLRENNDIMIPIIDSIITDDNYDKATKLMDFMFKITQTINKNEDSYIVLRKHILKTNEENEKVEQASAEVKGRINSKLIYAQNGLFIKLKNGIFINKRNGEETQKEIEYLHIPNLTITNSYEKDERTYSPKLIDTKYNLIPRNNINIVISDTLTIR